MFLVSGLIAKTMGSRACKHETTYIGEWGTDQVAKPQRHCEA